MAFSALAAIAAAVSAATAVGGTIVGSQNAAEANKTATGIASNNTVNAQNQQRYTAGLNAEAMKRAIAGSTNGRGDTSTYDPTTNSWKTQLSPTSRDIQRGSDQASVSRNTTDLAAGQRSNDTSMLDAIKARMAAGPALSAVQNFKPMSSQGLEGALQETATTANRNATDPIIADTLRSFARTGTAAGPVLTQMMRDNAGSLRTTMLNDKIGAMKNVGEINNTNRSGLVDQYMKLNAASKPTLNFSPIAPNSPSDALAQEINSRIAGAAQPASTGAYTTAGATAQSNNANEFAAKNTPVSSLGASIVGAGSQFKDLFKDDGALSKFINSDNAITRFFGGGGSGNNGDKPNTTFGGQMPQGNDWNKNGIY